MQKLECNREIPGIAPAELIGDKKAERPMRTNQICPTSELHPTIARGKFLFCRTEHVNRARAIPARSTWNLKYSHRTQRKFTASRLPRQMHIYATVTFLARTTGKTANVSQLTMRLPCDPTLPFCCYKARYFTGPSMGGMRGFTNSLSLRWSLLMRRH